MSPRKDTLARQDRTARFRSSSSMSTGLKLDSDSSLATATTMSTSTTTRIQSPSQGVPTRLLVQPLVASKVIKGEIHNVLTVMRSDPRYASPSRFVEEQEENLMHPLAVALEQVHKRLSYQDDYYNSVTTTSSSNSSSSPQELELAATVLFQTHLLDYLRPFCEAVQGRDVSASVTGAALTSLHKFLLYGFVLPETPQASSIMKLIAESLLNCRFEEEKQAPPTGLPQPQSVVKASHYAMEEQVVLKLLNVSALTVRCALQSDLLIAPKTIVGLLQTCLHVTHRAHHASPLLKSAAADALSQMVLQVFAARGAPVLEARHEILTQLARLLNPSQHAPTVTQTSLTLVNIALETCREPLSDEEISVLQNDMCKYLLLTSTTQDLLTLSLTLRVIFNLFYSIRNHLKVPLEVFLTSVHFRILDMPLTEEREVVLESLLEFCQEPALMKDIYRNYDCDIGCTNLYECMVGALGKVAMPAGYTPPSMAHTMTLTSGSSSSSTKAASSLHGLLEKDSNNKEALLNGMTSSSGASVQSGTSVTTSSAHSDSGVQQQAPSQRGIKAQSSLGAVQTQQNQPLPSQTPPTAVSTTPAPVTHLNRLALEGLLAILDSIHKRCFSTPRGRGHERQDSRESLTSDTELLLDDNVVTEEELRLQKAKKHSLTQVSHAFNDDPTKDTWIELAVEEGLLDNTDEKNARQVAELLHSAPGLDKGKLGIYLSKGPDEDYPFVAAVRASFVGLFDFSNLSFAAALRKFLSKFRLPGEAQCIDRFMETFSKELYQQRGEATSLFRNADAIYVLSFSTIMLNTDLHNPGIKEENRMTKAQFLRNNRGINGGEDLPEDFLNELYDQIKDAQLQVRREMEEVMLSHENIDFRTAWEHILAKSGEVSTPSFTPASDARKASVTASVHDQSMFKVLVKTLLPSLTGIFLRSWDDSMVVRALRGMKQVTRVASFFELDGIVDDVLLVLLPMGRDYIMGCVAIDFSGDNAADSRSVETAEDDDQTGFESEFPIPYGILNTDNDDKLDPQDYYGSASHRGILALDCSFFLLRRYGSGVSTAWPSFIQVLCALRDAQALPSGLADLDDFADSNGNVLPLTTYAKKSQRRLDDYYRSQSEQGATKAKGWGLARIFARKAEADKEQDSSDDVEDPATRRELSSYTRGLLAVAESSDVESVIQYGSTTFPVAEHTIISLLNTVGAYPYDENPVLEQHAVFSLELAARALLANKERSAELYGHFLKTFEGILARVSEKNFPAPFALERIVVTVLRCCIHLYDLPDLRPNLRASLHLLTMVLPKGFIKQISDRMACGLAIILRSSYHFFATPNEWAFMADTLDMLAHHNKARIFVFDGIASTVEFAIPQGDLGIRDTGIRDESSHVEDSYGEEHPGLTLDACNALSRILIRFVLGFYNHDTTLPIPAMLCLEKVYRRKCELLLQEEGKDLDGTDITPLAPDTEFWQNVAVAVYSACRSTEADISSHASSCFQRIIVATAVDQIPDDKWIAVLYLMVNKQPPLSYVESRANTFYIVGQLLAHVLPSLSHSEENREDLYDVIGVAASLAGENLKQGRRGNVTTLFEKTLQTLTYLSNHMVTEEWSGEPEFSTWASETLLAELEKVGAAGASFRNQAAVKPSPGSYNGSSGSSS